MCPTITGLILRLTKSHSKNQSALILDDDRQVLDLYEVWFQELGYGVTTCQNFTEFQDQLTSQTALIVLDLMMPDVDGISVLQYLQTQNISSPVLIISDANVDILSVTCTAAQAQGINILGSISKKTTFEGIARILQDVNDDTHFAHTNLSEVTQNANIQFYYQPLIRLDNFSVSGYEALMRVNQTNMDTSVLRYIESAPGAVELWWRSLKNIFETISGWPPEQTKVSINASPLVFSDPEFFSRYQDLAKTYTIEPNSISIELTERRTFSDPVKTAQTLTRLRLIGTGIVMDDFGKAYANIERLRLLPFTGLKFDRKFMLRAMHNKKARSNFEKALSVANNLEIQTTIEGIENEEQLNWAKHIGVELGQGYLFSHALPNDEVNQWTQRWKGLQ